MEAGGAGSTQFYARRDVDGFVSAAAERRIELEAEIAAAEARAERARAALNLHRIMAATLLDTQSEVEDVRRAAAAQAAEIINAAEEEVRAIEGPVTEVAVSNAALLAAMAEQLAVTEGSPPGDEPTVDLTGAEADDGAALDPEVEDLPGESDLADLDFDQFLDFLRDEAVAEHPSDSTPERS